MAAAGDKRPRLSFGTRDVSTVTKWGDDLVKWIWGMRADSSEATKVRAHAYIEVSGKIFCNGCGHDYPAHKNDFKTHLDSKGCIDSRGTGYRFDVGGHDAMLRMAVPATAREIYYEDKTEERTNMLSGVFLSHGLSYHSQETLFRRGAPALRAIQRIGSAGLGSDTTIARNVSKAVKQLELDLFLPQISLIRDHKLPLAILMDGSAFKAGGGGDAELVAVYCPVFKRPLIVDWKPLHKSPNADKLVEVAVQAVSGLVAADDIYATFGKGLLDVHAVGGGPLPQAGGAAAAAAAAAPIVPAATMGYRYLTPAEVLKMWAHTGADHASVMILLAERAKTTKVGDPGHASSLVIKAEVKAMGLGPPLKLARKVCLAPRLCRRILGSHWSLGMPCRCFCAKTPSCGMPCYVDSASTRRSGRHQRRGGRTSRAFCAF